MSQEDLTLDSLIVPNTQLYIVEGGYTKYFVKDYLTDELIEYIPIPGEKRYGASKVPTGSTYRDQGNTEKDNVSFMTKGLHPFKTPDFVSMSNGLYRVVLEPMVSYVSENMGTLLEKVSFKLESLATEEISYAKYEDIHERWYNGRHGVYNKEFCKDLYNISIKGSNYDRAFIKGLTYPGFFGDDLKYGESLVDGDTGEVDE